MRLPGFPFLASLLAALLCAPPLDASGAPGDGRPAAPSGPPRAVMAGPASPSAHPTGLPAARSAPLAAPRARGGKARRSASPSLSARFLPARLLAEDAAQAERFRALARGRGLDSTRWFAGNGRNLEVTQDLLSEMAAGLDPAASPRSLRPEGFAALLALRHGVRLRPAAPAWGSYSPDDPHYRDSPQWGLRNAGRVDGLPARAGVDIGIEAVWDKFSGSDTLVVAVLDAGFPFRHPELRGRHWVNAAEAAGIPGADDDGNGFVDDSTGWDFVEGDNDPEDHNGHGAYVSGVIAAGFDDGRGMAGILARGRVMAVRVLDAAGQGEQEQIAAGLRYALRNGAHVINFSIGGSGAHPDLQAAFAEARDRGVPIVGAAGNEGLDMDASPTLPSSLSDMANLVVVGSHGPDGSPSSFSNHGSRVHLAAPGERVLTCGIPDPVTAWSEDFEGADAASRWTFTAGMGISGTAPLDGARSLVWSSGGSVSATLAGTVDLRGKVGATLSFGLEFVPADATDLLIVEGIREGESRWREIAVIGEAVPAGTVLEFALRGLDGGQVRLRLRTLLGSKRSTAARRLRVDDLALAVQDPSPGTREVYAFVDGTSLAAPHVAAYVGLQRLACDRLGLPWTRARALEGLAAEPALAGKVSTGGRLDARRGLSFYLSTLPDLVVRDSTVLSWSGGQTVQYAMEVVEPGPGDRYRLQAYGPATGIRLDTASGKVTWTPGGPGEYVLKLVADGPVQLRRRLALSILPQGPTVPIAAVSAPAPLLRVAGRAWRLPPRSVLRGGRLDLWGADALGRARLLASLALTPSDLGLPLALSAASGGPGARPPFLRALLDGEPLEEVR